MSMTVQNLRDAAAKIDATADDLEHRAGEYDAPTARHCVEVAGQFRNRAAQIRRWASRAILTGVITSDMEARTREFLAYAGCAQ